MCHKTQAYNTYGEAIEARTDVIVEGRARNPQRLRAYWCVECEAYHLGHRSRGRRDRYRRKGGAGEGS
jgi:hypothetical protein